MDYKYNPYFSTQSQVVYELVTILGMHADGKLNNDELEKLVNRYVADYYEFIFDVEGNKAVMKGFPKQKLGKKRIRIIGTCLEKTKLVESFYLENSNFIARGFNHIA